MNEPCCTVESQSQCLENTKRLSRIINTTEDLINQLENKLESVLSPNIPATPSGTEDEKQLVPLASELRHQSDRLRANNEAMENILSRLEN